MLSDSHGRNIVYLRLSITDRCDFRCFYCLPRHHRDFTTPTEWLTPDEIERVVQQFAHLGVKHVRITGGEPLVRKEVIEIATRLSALSAIKERSLSTNASQLGRYASELKEAGVDRLNISLDTLNPDKFRQITGQPLDRVLHGIAAAKRCGFSPIKINMVVMRGINDDDVEGMIDYCLTQGLTLRLIETMPVGEGGRRANEHYLPLIEIKERLQLRYKLQPAAMQGSGPARYFQINNSKLIIGFITPKSQHFCDNCNRVRLSVSGELHLCLGQKDRLALGPMLRDGASDQDIQDAIRSAIAQKPLKHQFVETPTIIDGPMSSLGG
jgi:cyclic pyranopterin phosphate synthase